MSPMSSKPAIVICTGSFHLPEPYEPFVDLLQCQGFEVKIPVLPTSQVSHVTQNDLSGLDTTPPPDGWPSHYTDAEVIRKEVLLLIDAGQRVLLVAHSYGGIVATEAATRELQHSLRISRGLTGGVVGILYISAYILRVGQSSTSFFRPRGDEPAPPFTKIHGEGNTGLVTTVPGLGEEHFFGDLPPAEAAHYAAKLVAQPVISSPLRHATYVDIPCAYLLCKQDLVFPYAVQELMVKTARDAGGSMQTYTCNASHDPFLSRTQECVDHIKHFSTTI